MSVHLSGSYRPAAYKNWATGAARPAIRMSIVVAAMIIQMIGWGLLLSHNLPRAELAVSEYPALRNYLVLSADFEEYRDYFRDYPKRASEITDSNLFSEYYKRPLYGPISAGLTMALYAAFGLTFPVNMLLILSFYAAGASMLFFWLMRRSGLANPEAIAVTAISTLSFAWLSIFSVPESYSLTVCAAIIAMISGSRFSDADASAAISPWRHAVMIGVASWLYLPICGAVLLIIPSLRNARQWYTILIPCMLISVAIAGAPHLLNHAYSAHLQLEYAEKWTSFHHFVDPRTLTEVVSSFLFFALFAPVRDFVYASPELDIAAVVMNWMLVGGVVVQVVSYGLLVRYADWKRISGVVAWFLSLIAFHIFFNPKEVLLYLAVPVTVLCYAIALALSSEPVRKMSASPASRRAILAGLVSFTMLMAAVNVRPILGF